MKKVTVIILGIFVLPFLILWALAEAIGMGPVGYRIESKKVWDEVKDVPLVSAMGHWSESPFEEPYKLRGNVLHSDMSFEKWTKVMKENEFRIDIKDGHCGNGLYAIDFINTFDACALRRVGPDTCSYSYIIASNFDNNQMTEAIAVRTHFICL